VIAPQRAGWVVWSLGVVVAVVYAYAVVAAVGNLMGIPSVADAIGLGVSAVGWVWLSISVALPVFGFAVALLIGRGRPGWAKILLLVTGLCVVAVAQIDILHVVPQSNFFG
jgi:hypothetical protein